MEQEKITAEAAEIKEVGDKIKAENAKLSINPTEIDNKVLMQSVKKASLAKGYNVGFILSIVGLCLTGLYCLGVIYFMSAWILITLAAVFVGIQEFRQDKVASGACIILLGGLTFGIYPLVMALKRRKNLKVEHKHEDEMQVNLEIASLQKGYQASFILSIIAIATAIIIVGIYVGLIAAIIVMIQEMRQGRIMSGVGYYFAICCTFGIVGIVMCNKRRKAEYWENLKAAEQVVA